VNDRIKPNLTAAPRVGYLPISMPMAIAATMATMLVSAAAAQGPATHPGNHPSGSTIGTCMQESLGLTHYGGIGQSQISNHGLLITCKNNPPVP
jgi:hypothetical protein